MQLRVVTWVLGHHPALHAALPHLAPLVSDFLGPDPNLSLTEACTLGSTQLLDWLWGRSCASADARPEGWSLCNFLRSDPYYYRYQFYEAIEVAAGQGDVSVVTWLMDHFSGCEVPSAAVAGAAHKGHLPVLQLLLDKDAGRARPHKLDRLEVEDNEWEDSAAEMPADWTGPGNVVRWGGRAIFSAVCSGKIDVARWLYDHTPHQISEEDVHATVERAVMTGQLEFAEFLLPRGRKIADYVGQIMGPDAVEPLLQRGCLKENKNAAIGAIWVAAREGKLDLMKRIAAQHPKPPRGKNSEWLQFWGYAMSSACEGGNVDMIMWMMEHPTGQLLCKQMKEDFIMNNYDELLQKAAEGGHVEAMAHLVEQGCKDEYATAMLKAARKGHLHCIEWLLEHTYQYQSGGSADRIVVEAAKRGDLDILKFFHAPRYAAEEMSEKKRKIEDSGAWWGRSREAMDEAVINGRLEVVKWLHANRSEVCSSVAADRAAENGHLEVLKWLESVMTANWTANTMDAAAGGGHLDIVKWLHANRSDGCTIKAVENAVGNGKLRVASWLCWYYPEFVPEHKGLWMYPKNLFDALLFIQVNYPDAFTVEFGRGTIADLADEMRKGSEILVKKWLEEKFPARSAKQRRRR